MNNQPVNITANSLGSVARCYGVGLDVLLGWIEIYPLLKEKIKPYRDGKKIVYPPAIIKEIFETLGEP